jgi:hypothetical protein
MISLERQICRYTESEAPIQPAEAFKVKYYRLEADLLLVEAGVDPKTEPPVADTIERQNQPPAPLGLR